MTTPISKRHEAHAAHGFRVSQHPENKSLRTTKTVSTDDRFRSAFRGEESRTQKWRARAGDASFSAASSGGNAALSPALASALGEVPPKTWEGAATGKVAVEQWDGQFKSAHAAGTGHVEVLSAHAKAEGSVTWASEGLFAHGEVAAGANLAQAEGRMKAGYGPLQAEVNGQAYVGVKGNAVGDVTVDPVNGVYAARVGGQAFAGAKAGVEGSVKLGRFGSVGGSAEAWAGLGVKANAELGFDRGVFKFKVDVGAALGIGCKFGVSGEINLRALGQAASRAIDRGIALATDALGSFLAHPAMSFKKLLGWLF